MIEKMSLRARAKRGRSNLIIYCGFIMVLSNLTAFSKIGASAIFLNNGIDARTSGMGNTWTTVYSGVYNVYNNPALLYQLEKHNITGTYTMEFSDIRNNFIGYGHSVSTKTGIAFGWYRTGTSIEETTESEQILGENQFIADCFFSGIGYNAKIPGPLGLTLKYINESFGKFYLSGIGFDLGIIPIASKSFKVGVTLKDIFGTKLEGKSYWSNETIKETIETKLRIGAMYFSETELEIPKGSIKFNTKFLIDYEQNFFYPGAEIFIQEIFGLRMGWLSGRGLTFGFSFWYKKINIDYAFLLNENLGNSHRFTTCLKL